MNATDEYLEWFGKQTAKGNKKGKNEKSFYKNLIQLAEMLIERYRP